MKAATSTPDDLVHQLAFENSLQPNIITIVSSGKIIMANKAAVKLLGYPFRILVTKSRADIFAIAEKSFKKMLKERTSDGHSTALVTAITKTGKELPCEITSAVFSGSDRIKKAITTITDISRQLLQQQKIDAKKEKMAIATADQRVAVNNEWIRYIAKASYDVMWDWDVATGDVYVGDSIQEAFGYKVKQNCIRFEHFLRFLLPEDKAAFEKKLAKSMSSAAKSWKDACVLKRYDGSLAASISRASIIRDDKGNAIRLIGATQNISTLQTLEKKLEAQITEQQEHSQRFNLAAKLSYDVIWDWNILTNTFFLGEGFEELFGYTSSTPGNISFDWDSFVHPNDKASMQKEIRDVLNSSALHWEFAHRITRGDDTVAYVLNKASIIRDATGKACRMIGVIHDLSMNSTAEEQLEQEIRVKEKQMAEAMEDARNAARTHIAKELHDNVNQLLAASSMFIEMAKKGGGNSKIYLDRSSEYTMMAIEDIRKLTRGLSTEIISNLGLCAAVENLADDMKKASGVKIKFVTDGFIEAGVDNTFKLNIYRIVQEQLNNILKHAKAAAVDIHLSQTTVAVTLAIADNGVGFDTSTKQKGIGIANIKSRAAVYSGTADFISTPGNGCILTVNFPAAAIPFDH